MAESNGAGIVQGNLSPLAGGDWLAASGLVFPSGRVDGYVAFLRGGDHGGIQRVQMAYIPRCRAGTLVCAIVHHSFHGVSRELVCHR